MSEIDPIYRELAGKLDMEGSELLQRILAKLANLEQARIVRELPTPLEEIADKLNLDKETVARHIQELIEKGLVVPTRKGPQMARTLIQLHDASLSDTKYDEALGDEFFDLWKELMGKEFFDESVEVIAGGEQPMWRIIPRWKAIKDVPGVLPFEDAREILKSQEVLALVHCPCKREHRQRECGIPDEVCLNVGRTAQYNINRGAGKEITVARALEVIEECDQYPLIHMLPNQRAVNQLLCNCHWCCCGPLRPMVEQTKYPITRGIAKSRFEAVVDPERCTGCEICLDWCQFGAISMQASPENGGELAFIDPEKCMGCGCCVISCPSEACSMKLVRPPEHVPEGLGGIY